MASKNFTYRSLEYGTPSRTVIPARDAERSPENFSESELHARIHCSTAPIGVFDSGVGGLTILTALRRQLPSEDYLFLGDTGRCPYGLRSAEEVTTFALQISDFLIKQGAKMIVVACNTASQAALNTLRATYAIPFVGVVPAVKPAARLTRSGRIGILATNQAARATYLRQLIDDFAEGIEVEAVGCPELVDLAEQGKFEGPEVDEVLQRTLHPMLAKGVDVIVLGCTHFPAMRPAIERIVGKRVQVIDSGTAIARRVHAILESEACWHPYNPEGGALQVWCSGDPAAFSNIASKLLGYPVRAQQALL
ncbi:MAG TPA: glutamate racemase [Ktedonobacteraceae bacterium]|nr:glutamate racemase [Ktedonobacteraceae bacterium]